ncbi:MAG: 50S ribosomal protein L30 [Chloroflexota bacterium]|nr:50S ribosomal protein L30 [Chloroflexota bacterium]
MDEAKGSGKLIKITWVRSGIGYPRNQQATIKALGLHRLHETVERSDTPQLRGQIFKVKHMLKVEE